MRICSNCGTINADDARFCENCGTKLEGEPITTPSAEEPAEYGPAEDGSEEQVVRLSQRRRQQQQQDSTQKQITIKKPDIGKMKSGIRKLTKIQKIVIAEVICLAVVIAAFFVIGDRKYSAQSVAERYFDAYAARDWKTVYGLLELPQGSFMHESQFEEMM